LKSIGNDIVALKAINKQRSNDVRFYSKFITVSEQSLYQQPSITVMPFENYVWLLWTVKESAYKYLKRIYADLIFSPTKIIIQNITVPTIPLAPKLIANEWDDDVLGDGFYNGEVIYGTHSLYFKSIVDDELIASMVNDDPSFKNIHFSIQSINDPSSENQSRSVREFLLSKLKIILPGGDLKVEKAASGYPIVLKDSKEMNLQVSFAHHHQFTSYCFKSNLV
jgi:phosphopantetheinyl transferase (holo-ACP synthase)